MTAEGARSVNEELRKTVTDAQKIWKSLYMIQEKALQTIMEAQKMKDEARKMMDEAIKMKDRSKNAGEP